MRQRMRWTFGRHADSRKGAREVMCPHGACNTIYGGSGELAGVGMILRTLPDNSLYVRKLVEGSAAEAAGIRPGDCIMEVCTVVFFSLLDTFVCLYVPFFE